MTEEAALYQDRPLVHFGSALSALYWVYRMSLLREGSFLSLIQVARDLDWDFPYAQCYTIKLKPLYSILVVQNISRAIKQTNHMHNCNPQEFHLFLRLCINLNFLI